MSQLPIDFAAARAARDAGISRALTSANNVNATWSERAYDWLLLYIDHVRLAGKNTLTSEDARGYAHTRGLPMPPSNRAWGGPFLKARRAGLLVRAGITEARDPGCHMGIRNVWRIVGTETPDTQALRIA